MAGDGPRPREGDSPPGNQPEKHLLFLVGQLGYGGSERQLALLLEAIRGWGIRTTVLVFHPSPNMDLGEQLEAAGIDVVRRPSWMRGFLGKFAATAYLVRRLRPDVVQSWSAHDNVLAAAMRVIHKECAILGAVRGPLALPGFQSLPRLVQRAVLFGPDALVVNSGELKEDVVRRGVPPDQVVLLPNCVDVERWRPRRTRGLVLPEYGIRKRHEIVINVGNLRPPKAQVDFVRALAVVIRKRPSVRGLIVGETIDEAVENSVRREIERQAMSGRIVLLGFRSDVPQLLQRSHVFVLSSRQEGTPNVMLEAMACGVPVVATRVGGVPDVIAEGQDGILVNPSSPGEIACGVLHLLEDEALADRIACSARKKVATSYRCNLMARRLLAAYAKLCGDQRLLDGA